ncbi:MAG: hypothetical protein OEQ18_10755 [Gammaproteobacteria bacterium]|nr:hypothetical protein [Gammaproteobacteria bacterium]
MRKLKPRQFFWQHGEQLVVPGVSAFSKNVMLAVLANEGRLNAVNTWDNAFVSFRMLM